MCQAGVQYDLGLVNSNANIFIQRTYGLQAFDVSYSSTDTLPVSYHVAYSQHASKTFLCDAGNASHARMQESSRLQATFLGDICTHQTYSTAAELA